PLHHLKRLCTSHKLLPTLGTGTYYHEVPPQEPQPQLCEHQGTPQRVKPQPASHTHTSDSLWQSMSRKARLHYMGTDYWFMTSVSNPDNTTQELPLSLVATDVRSSCSSTTTCKAKELWRPTKPPHLQAHAWHL
ncbi:hypothetical protein Taro_049422, partial [Colocasia esculenta]|nr:hypothetical protein [Colocasia esculenta]